MTRNVVNDLNIENELRKLPNFNMEDSMVYLNCRKQIQVQMIKENISSPKIWYIHS